MSLGLITGWKICYLLLLKLIRNNPLKVYWIDLKIPVRKNPPTPLIRGALVYRRRSENKLQ